MADPVVTPGATYLSPADVAEITGLSSYTIRAALREGELRGSKRRGRYLIHPDDLAAWIDEGRVVPRGGTVPRGLPRSPVPPPRRGSAGDDDVARARALRQRRRAA